MYNIHFKNVTRIIDRVQPTADRINNLDFWILKEKRKKTRTKIQNLNSPRHAVQNTIDSSLKCFSFFFFLQIKFDIKPTKSRLIHTYENWDYFSFQKIHIVVNVYISMCTYIFILFVLLRYIRMNIFILFRGNTTVKYVRM